VVLVGGSEGGLHELDAALLAARGFAVLALAYFGMRGVPPVLVDIPLEYFGGALAWLRDRDEVRGGRLGVIGGSRGGEAALLIGATFPEVGAVVSTVGSGLITQGIGMGRGLVEILEQPVASWTWRGRPLPYLRNEVPPELKQQVAAREPCELRLAFLPGLADREAVAAATIPVERIQGAVLLVSAGDDRMWPCAALSEIAVERLTAARHPHPFRHLTYPTAGHPIAPPPYGPATELISPGPGVLFATGGTPERNAAARADAWAKSVAFLTEHLTP
jgi:dienelactone hydrolase